jgi:hypothetical protein
METDAILSCFSTNTNPVVNTPGTVLVYIVFQRKRIVMGRKIELSHFYDAACEECLLTSLQRSHFFLKRFIAQRVYTECTKINYVIIPVTNLNKY